MVISWWECYVISLHPTRHRHQNKVKKNYFTHSHYVVKLSCCFNDGKKSNDADIRDDDYDDDDDGHDADEMVMIMIITETTTVISVMITATTVS